MGFTTRSYISFEHWWLHLVYGARNIKRLIKNYGDSETMMHYGSITTLCKMWDCETLWIDYNFMDVIKIKCWLYQFLSLRYLIFYYV